LKSGLKHIIKEEQNILLEIEHPPFQILPNQRSRGSIDIRNEKEQPIEIIPPVPRKSHNLKQETAKKKLSLQHKASACRKIFHTQERRLKWKKEKDYQ
jgi:hypothetical protein